MLFLQDTLTDDTPRFENGTPENGGEPLHRVSMEEVQRFLAFRKKTARLIPFGLALCVLSPISLILLAVAQESGLLPLAEQKAAGLGLLVLIVLVGIAVALFILSGITGKSFEHLSLEGFETEPGVKEFVREEKEKDNGVFAAQLVTGIVLCVLSVVPIFLTMIFASEQTSDFSYAVAVAALLCFVAVGVWLIVHASIRRGGYSVLLEEGDYTPAKKKEQKRTQPIASIYWCLITAGYLAYSFITSDWQRSWIVWPVAGVLFGVIMAIVSSLGGKDSR